MKSSKIRYLVLGMLVCMASFFFWKKDYDNRSALANAVPAAATESTEPSTSQPESAQFPNRLRKLESLQFANDAEKAPRWAVMFGGEFWRRQTPDSSIDEDASEAPSVANPPFSLGDVIDRVQHALVEDPATGSFSVTAGSYIASFDGQGLRFSPYRNEEMPAEISDQNSEINQEETDKVAASGSKPDPETAILFRTESIEGSGYYFYSANRDAANWSIMGNTAQGLLSSDWGMVEHYEMVNQGVEATWLFQKPLPGTGPIEVIASVEGLNYAGETEVGHHYADNSGVARVFVGSSYAVDAAGTRWHLDTRAATDGSGKLVIELPAAIQTEAVYPLAIDPIIGSEFGMDKPISSNASGSQANACVASVAGSYFVAWEDSRNNSGTGTDIYGARVSINGTILDPLGLAISTAPRNQTSPAIAVSGTTFFVVWRDQRLGQNNIFGARVTTQGVLSDPLGLAICADPAGQFNPTVAAGATNFFVAWEDDRNSASNGTDIYGARVTTLGVVADPIGIAISANASDQLLPAVTTNSGGFFVAWQDSRNAGTTGTDIYSARVSKAGVLLDPTGVPLSTAGSNQTEVNAAVSGDMVAVTWRDRRASGTTSDDIYGTRVTFTNNAITVLDTNGIAISTDAASQRTPVVCALSNNFLVVWRDRRNSGNTSDDIYAARVDKSGAVMDPSGFAICTNSASQSAPAVASTSSGALVVWTDPRNSITGNDIYGARILNTGASLDTNNIPISLAGAAETVPVVAFNGTNYLVAWQDARNFTTNGTDILGTRVSKSGAVLDLKGIVICAQAASQRRPAVTASGGEFLAAWEDDRNTLTTGIDIYGTRVSGGGIVLDSAGLALSTAVGDEATPTVAGNPSTFLVAWEDNRNGSAPDIYATLVSQGGIISNPAGIPISTRGGNEIRPTLAASTNGFLTVWEDNNDIFAARVTSTGTVLDTSGNSIQLTSQGNESFPSVAALGTNYLITWTDDRNFSSDIYAARVFGDGTVPDFDGFPVCTMPNNQFNPAVAANADTWLIVWQNQGPRGADNDLYSARVSADGNVQDFWSVPLVGTSDRVSPRLAFGGAGRFLLVSQGFRSNSQRIAANVLTADPVTTHPFVQFSKPAYSVRKNLKSASVTVTLAGKISGLVTVDFSTADDTARAGYAYMPVATRMEFTNKKISTVVSIPIIAGQTTQSAQTVILTLRNPTGGALLGANHTATLTVLP